ncbi:Uncharacterised protein [Mycobacterium tuberculosis]|uniref:Uncharacterized protein n=1 Tax=Mycobacterium tuberculosis TaxID=1773 RepID=A0A654U5R6_MYCTX|nr:Uncharacterised protein [Mycobacterium tuberculosis]COX63017.1 Uncharacterised protein [Mycobacterium tuberculosis]
MTSSARHGVRSKIAFSVPMPPPECLAPLGVPVVPEVSRITFPWLPVCSGRRPACAATSFSTVRSWSSSVHATIRVACGFSASARSTVALNSSS